MGLIENIDDALVEVENVAAADVESLYQQVGVFFNEQVKKRFNQVSTFHKRVAQNREAHLKRERKRTGSLRTAED